MVRTKLKRAIKVDLIDTLLYMEEPQQQIDFNINWLINHELKQIDLSIGQCDELHK